MNIIEMQNRLMTAHLNRCTEAGVWFTLRVNNAMNGCFTLEQARAAVADLTKEFDTTRANSLEQYELAMRQLNAICDEA